MSRAGKTRVWDLLFSWDPPVGGHLCTPRPGIELPTPFKSPIKHDRLEALLRGHPDQLSVALALDMLRNGAPIGYKGGRGTLRLEGNHRSAVRNRDAVMAILRKDQQAGTLSQWYDEPPLEGFVTSPMGAVPKGNEEGFRGVKDMSFSSGVHSSAAKLRVIRRDGGKGEGSGPSGVANEN